MVKSIRGFYAYCAQVPTYNGSIRCNLEAAEFCDMLRSFESAVAEGTLHCEWHIFQTIILSPQIAIVKGVLLSFRYIIFIANARINHRQCVIIAVFRQANTEHRLQLAAYSSSLCSCGYVYELKFNLSHISIYARTDLPEALLHGVVGHCLRSVYLPPIVKRIILSARTLPCYATSRMVLCTNLRSCPCLVLCCQAEEPKL